MSAKGVNLVTLADVAKSENRAIGDVAEVLLLSNPILNDIPYMEMNEGTKHCESIRSGLPDVYYRKANQPIPASKSTTEERTFQAAHFESKSQLDEAVAMRGGADRIGYNRWNQAQGHIQAMGNEQASLLIYGSPESSDRKVPGLMDVYSTLTGTTVGKQVLDAGGSGSDNASILLTHWGPQSIFGVYPAGTQAGLKRTDRSSGQQRVQIQGTDELGNPGMFWGYEEDFAIDHGVVVKDYRQGARIANIDISDLQSGTGAADLIKLMILATKKIQYSNVGRGVFYCNRTIEAFLHLQALEKVSAGAGLRFENYQGGQVLMFLGRPVRVCDSMLNSEAQVV